jgi:transcriptional regulator
MEPIDRARLVLMLARRGHRQSDIARTLRITKQRVSQIVLAAARTRRQAAGV